MKIETRYNIGELVWTRDQEYAGFIKYLYIYLNDKKEIKVEYTLTNGQHFIEEKLIGMGDP